MEQCGCEDVYSKPLDKTTIRIGDRSSRRAEAINKRNWIHGTSDIYLFSGYWELPKSAREEIIYHEYRHSLDFVFGKGTSMDSIDVGRTNTADAWAKDLKNGEKNNVCPKGGKLQPLDKFDGRPVWKRLWDEGLF